MLFFPALNFALAVATNIETDKQAQPADVLCFAYNAIAGVLLGKEDVQCVFKKDDYYGSGCTCDPLEGRVDVII